MSLRYALGFVTHLKVGTGRVGSWRLLCSSGSSAERQKESPATALRGKRAPNWQPRTAACLKTPGGGSLTSCNMHIHAFLPHSLSLSLSHIQRSSSRRKWRTMAGNSWLRVTRTERHAFPILSAADHEGHSTATPLSILTHTHAFVWQAWPGRVLAYSAAGIHSGLNSNKELISSHLTCYLMSLIRFFHCNCNGLY